MHVAAGSLPATAEDAAGRMRVVPYDDSRRGEWDAFVDAHPMAGYGHQSATFALAAASSAVNHSLMLYDEGRLQGVLPLFLVGSRVLRVVPVKTLRSGFEFPAGPLLASTAPKTIDRHLASLVGQAIAVADRLGCDSLRLTYPTITDDRTAIERYGYLPLRVFGFTETNVVSLVLDLAGEPSFERRAAYACRQSIRRAQELGAVVSVITDRATWDRCHELNVQTMGPLALSREQMEVVWREFVENGLATPFGCVVDGEIVSVIVTLHARTASYYWLGFNRRPPARGTAHLTLHEAIRHARDRGTRFFELGSREFSHTKQLAISRFKESFGGSPCYALDGVLERRPMKKALVDLALATVGTVRKRRKGESDVGAAPG